MPRSNNSKSRSRSPKRWKRYERQSSESDRGHRRKVRYQQPSKIQSKKSKYDIEAKSDIKNHIRYDNIPASSRRQEQKIMEQTEEALRTEYGSIQHITKVDSNQNEFSFVVGFKYDRDAYNFIKADSHYLISDKKKVYAKPTAVFEQCIPLIRQAKKQLKSKNKSRSPSKRRNNHSTSSQRHKKKRQKSKDRRDSRSYQRNQREQNKKKVEEKSVWIFGLPWSIKGPEIVNYLEKHPAGSFYVSSWKWVRAPETNCELMKVTMDAKKAQKLLAFRQQHSIQGSPCIITNCSYEQNPEAIKESLKQYQFKISFPQKINPASLYKVFNQNTTVVQIVSCYRLEDGRSDAFIVTLGNATKAREVKRLSLRQSGIRVEDIRGQLVYRPTKHSKLIENQRSH